MIKKKAKGSTAAKKPAKKKSTQKSKKDRDPAEVRKNIAIRVKAQAEAMADAVIGEGKKGQLATVKYLFEVAKIFPEATDGSQATAEEESLAKTLLRRLDLPDEPVVRDEEDPPKAVTPAEKAAPKPAEQEEDSGAAPEESESKDSVVV
jgi:hypothetical protein